MEGCGVEWSVVELSGVVESVECCGVKWSVVKLSGVLWS